jgi:molybdopterin synthase sulfur carrier subunit
MKVRVKLFASLRQFGPDEQLQEFPEGATIDQVIDVLKIPRTIRLLKIVNGEHQRPDHVLKDGDDLALFPPIAGGSFLRSPSRRVNGNRNKHLARAFQHRTSLERLGGDRFTVERSPVSLPEFRSPPAQ